MELAVFELLLCMPGGGLGLTSALSGAQHTPRSGILLLRVRDEQPVKTRRA